MWDLGRQGRTAAGKPPDPRLRRDGAAPAAPGAGAAGAPDGDRAGACAVRSFRDEHEGTRPPFRTVSGPASPERDGSSDRGPRSPCRADVGVPCLPEGPVVPEPFDAVTPVPAGTRRVSGGGDCTPTVGVGEEFVPPARRPRGAAACTGPPPWWVAMRRARARAARLPLVEVSAAAWCGDRQRGGPYRRGLAAETSGLRSGAGSAAAAEYEPSPGARPALRSSVSKPRRPSWNKARYRAFGAFGPLAHDQGVNARHVHVVRLIARGRTVDHHVRGWMPRCWPSPPTPVQRR